MGKSQVRNFLRPPPSRQGNTFCAPLLKSGNFLRPPPLPSSIWLKLPSYCIKLPQNLLCPPPFSMAKTPPPPFFRRDKISHAPRPSSFVAPPPPLPIISDQSLRSHPLAVDAASTYQPVCGIHVQSTQLAARSDWGPVDNLWAQLRQTGPTCLHQDANTLTSSPLELRSMASSHSLIPKDLLTSSRGFRV